MTDMTSKVPKVSVCVVTYNHEQYIRTCLQSIVDQKTDFDFEVIVGEDCSSDGTRVIVQEFAEKYPCIVKPLFHEKNLGASQNYLHVLQSARGEFICHCDGDDYWLPSKLQEQLSFMEQNPECNVAGHRMYLTMDGDELSEDGRGDFPRLAKIAAFYEYGNFLPHSSTMFRASRARAPEKGMETIDFLLHIWRVQDGQIGFLNKYLGVYRQHGNSMTASAHQSLNYFNWNLAALDEIHKLVKDEDKLQKRKFALCRMCIKDFIAAGRIDLAKEIALNSGKYVSCKRHKALLKAMVYLNVPLRWGVRMKRKYWQHQSRQQPAALKLPRAC